MNDRLPPQKSRSVTVLLVTLHREPPLTRILAPGARAPSRSTTEQERLNRRAKIAVARPAAPAPTMATSQCAGRSAFRCEKCSPKTGGRESLNDHSGDNGTLPRSIDQDNAGVLPRAVEHDVLPVGCDVESP